VCVDGPLSGRVRSVRNHGASFEFVVHDKHHCQTVQCQTTGVDISAAQLGAAEPALSPDVQMARPARLQVVVVAAMHVVLIARGGAATHSRLSPGVTNWQTAERGGPQSSDDPVRATRSVGSAGLALPLLKLRKTDEAGDLPDVISVVSAMNEFESFQVVLSGPLTAVSVDVAVTTDTNSRSGSAPPSLRGGHAREGITVLKAAVYAARYVNVSQASGCMGSVGFWPDPLVRHSLTHT
jgi:hypothetical protein